MSAKLVSVIVAVAVLAFLVGASLPQNIVYVEEPAQQAAYTQALGANFASIMVPAVDNEGNGVSTTIDVQAMPGSGKTLTNIDKLFFWIDTQNSIRIARDVAQNVTGKDLGKWDIIYTINANASVIEGPSAGAALTVATIAALENRTINKSVMMTGTISEDGAIGPVGGIPQKAQAAKIAGATVFLIPAGYAAESAGYGKEKVCQKTGNVSWCEIKYVPKTTDLSTDFGIEIREVGNVRDVLGWFGL